MRRIVALIAALILVPTLSVAQNTGLKCKNDRYTFGLHGQQRKENKFLPNDLVWLAFDVEGLKVQKDGEINYSVGFEITRKVKGGKPVSVHKRTPVPLTAYNHLGTTTSPLSVVWPVPNDAVAGEYTFAVTVEEAKPKKSYTLEKDFEVLAPKYGVVQLSVSGIGGLPAPPLAVAGQHMELRWIVVGAEVDKKDKKYKINFTVNIQENGKDVVEKPLTGDLEIDNKEITLAGVVPFQPYRMLLNRPGKFKILLATKCNVTGKETSDTLDLTVLDSK